MKRWRVALAMVLMAVAPAAAQQRTPELSAALITDFVAVTTNFSGATITLFGATRAVGARRGDVVVVVRGIDRPVTVSKRTPVAGVWVGQERVTFEAAPTFLSVATAKPLSEIVPEEAQERYRLTPQSRLVASEADADRADIDEFRDALIRVRTQNGLYAQDPIGVRLLLGGLFRADIRMPDSTAPGLYTADIYMFRDGRLRGQVTSTLVISKEGLERQTYAFSREQPVIYALSAVAMAMLAGWLAAVIFRRAGA